MSIDLPGCATKGVAESDTMPAEGVRYKLTCAITYRRKIHISGQRIFVPEGPNDHAADLVIEPSSRDLAAKAFDDRYSYGEK